jgi:hypothetical protein
MNPEEFDKRLKQAFKTENLIPKEDLWENIASQIQPNQKKGFWHFLTPFMIIAVISSVSAYYLLTDKQSISIASDKNIAKIDFNNNDKKNIQNYELKRTNTTQTPAKKSDLNIQSSIDDSYTELNNSKHAKQQTNSNRQQNKSISRNKLILNNNKSEKQAEHSFVSQTSVNMIDIFSISKINFRLKQQMPIFSNELLKSENNIFLSKTVNNKTKSLNDAKWSLIFGIGPQLALNKIKIPEEHLPFVHKNLWDNQNQLTHNGTGFHTNLFLNYKFSKLFSLESGIEYGIRTEDIKLDISSDEIAIRTANNNILKYEKLKLLVIVINPDGTKDSTFYDAISSFNLAVNNKYQSFTIPINLRTEFKISDNTVMQIGLGGGLTYLYSKKSTHYDILNEKKIEDHKNKLLTSSLNTRLSLLTNFNDIGRIGVYTGFQLYTTPWQAINNQYNISMRDFQIGMTYQKPLNW